MNADTYATTAAQRVAELRHSSVRLAVVALYDGDPQHALKIMLASLFAQARITGIRFES